MTGAGTGSGAQETFDRDRQAELARELTRLAARPAVDVADVLTGAARVLAPPPAVARVFDPSDEPDPDT